MIAGVSFPTSIWPPPSNCKEYISLNITSAFIYVSSLSSSLSRPVSLTITFTGPGEVGKTRSLYGSPSACLTVAVFVSLVPTLKWPEPYKIQSSAWFD